MSRVEAVGGKGSGEAGTERTEACLERFLRACAGGQDIDDIILRDAAYQRRIASSMRSAQRECQRRAVAQAAQRIVGAAWKGVYSAVFSAGVQLAVAYTCYRLDVASGLAQSGASGELQKLAVKAEYGLYSKLVGAVGTCCDHVTPWTIGEAADRAAAEKLQFEAGMAGQQAADASDWLRGIKELEQKLISHLEKIAELDHQANKTVIDRMGS